MSAEPYAFESPFADSEREVADSAHSIAIVGMAGRFPGAEDLAQFWRLLAEGGAAITRTDRQPRPCGFLRDVTGMDAGFFATSATEAAAMDPQQRLLLELGWEALEDSRISPKAQRGRAVGVFVGAMHGDYEVLSSGSEPTRHTLTGVNRGMLANRISHFLGLRGPSLTVDAGQASSLVAVHLAVQSIRRGECAQALAGGVNLLLGEHETRVAENFGALSPDHRCYTFDERANGYVRGEGGALVALKPLAAALAAGDRVYAVIEGSSVNNDGDTGDSLTAPSVDAQVEVLRAALVDAGSPPQLVDYVELHGTGTPVGDPIEAAALGRVYGTARGRRGALRVGSVKTNIGHLESAAGIAGLVKAALAFRHAELPPSRNFRTANPRIPLAELGLEVVGNQVPWETTPSVLAGVSSFGMGGVNCHVVLSGSPESMRASESAASVGDPRAVAPLGNAHATPFVLSAASPEALRALATRLKTVLAPDTDLGALAYSLHATRARHDHRAVVFGHDRQDLNSGLTAIYSNTPASQAITGRAARSDRGITGRIAFVFPGQGAQKPGMARELYRTVPRFATHLDKIVEYFTPHLDVDLLDLLIGEHESSALLDQTRYTQPALFAVEFALFRLVVDLGVEPDYLIGHSIGELVAATASGALEPVDAARLVAERGRLMQSAAGAGAMVAIAAAEEQVTAHRATTGATFDIAAVNHSEATVISGPAEIVVEVGEHFAAQGHRTSKLAVSHAFHSAQMDAVLDEFRTALVGTDIGPLAIPVLSNLTGELLTDAELADPDYLGKQLRNTVRFGAGIQTLLDRDVTTFLELGPGAGLSSMIRAASAGGSIATVPALRDSSVDAEGLVRVLGELECAGVGIDWTGLIGSRQRIDLPTYPFQRKPYWLAAANDTVIPTVLTPPFTEQASVSTSAAFDAAGAVRAALAGVLGLTAPTHDELRSDFKALGMDSLGSVQFRDVLAEASGLTLSAALVYDHPTPRAVTAHLAGLLAGEPHSIEPAVVDAVNQHDAQRITGRSEYTALSDDDVVIVATAGRWPGGLDTPEDFWAALVAGSDHTGEFPRDRDWFLDQERGDGKSAARRGGFLYDAAEFDASFFGIGPREAEAMDPQQRLLLESTWTCLQRAGLAPSSLRGTATGVYIGSVQQEYGPRMHEADDSAAGYLLTGTTNSVISGRLAYQFGFAGPTVTIDTACSSSLVALHLAVRALRARECDLAVVGGVCVMSTPGMFTEFDKQGGLAADGRCKPFADEADGTVWGEAVATLLVERRADAIRSGHRVLAVVRGTAINSDGASNGLTAPNGSAQQRVIAAALADARLTPDAVDVVEAHGTGTALGDPIEAEALGAVYGRAHTARQPVLVGSAKSNIGHTQAAAGVTGVIKLVEALRSGVVAPTVHVATPSRLVDWAGAHLHVPTEPVDWPSTGGPRIAAVSSFGISGTNAHVILQQPGETAAVAATSELPVPLIFSARSSSSLRAYASALLEAGAPADDVAAVASELLRVDEGFAHRAVIRPVAEEIRDALTAIAEGGYHPGAFLAQPPASARAFVFSGQGSQRIGMGVRLAATVPAFDAELTEVAAHLDPHLPVPLATVLAGEDGDDLLHRTRYTQPAIFAFEVALARWLESVGVTPDFVAGHSIGELAAAQVAGVLGLADASRMVAARGRLMDEIEADGAMAALEATEAEVVAALDSATGVDIAAVNGPRATVISGDRGAVEQLAEVFRADGRKARLLNVSHAFHSSHMDAIADEFLRVVRTVRIEDPKIPLVSGLTGQIVRSAAELGGDYWLRHARHAVRFADVARTLSEAGVRTFLEVGPDAVLLPMLTQSVPQQSVVVASTTRRADEATSVVRALETLYLDGVDVRWRALRDTEPVDAAPLPGYAFTRTRYWSGSGTPAGHPFLGPIARSAEAGILLTGVVSLDVAPWLADHVVGGAAIFPGTGFLDLALYAAAVSGADEVVEIDLTVPMVLDESARMLAVELLSEGGNSTAFSIQSRTASTEWVTHATGLLGRGDDRSTEDPAEGELRVPHHAPEDLYPHLATDGYKYGPAFRNLRRLADDDARLLATLELDRSTTDLGHRVHPALLDAALHPLVAALLSDGSGPVVPAQFRGVRVRARPTGTVLAELTRTGAHRAGIRLATQDGRALVEVDAVTFLPTAPPKSENDGVPGRLVWVPGAPIAARSHGDVAVLGSVRGGSSADTFETLAALRSAVGAGRAVPDAVLTSVGGSVPDDIVTATHHLVAEHIALLQEWVHDELFATAELVLIIENESTTNDLDSIAVLTTDGDDKPVPYALLPSQVLAGLVRSAQHEWPGRLRLINADAGADMRQIASALVSTTDPELTVREGNTLRITVEPVDTGESLAVNAPPVRTGEGESPTDSGPTAEDNGASSMSLAESGSVELAANTAAAQRIQATREASLPNGVTGAGVITGTVLVTGASGALARLVCRHLVVEHGVRRLLLVSRGRIPARTIEELGELGAEIRTAAVDVADAEQVRALIAGIDSSAPLTAVFHLAGVLDDAALVNVEPEQITRILRPKVDGAWNLHEQTKDLDGLAAFVLFSSMVATTGNPGQTAYGAANSFLDGLARTRHRHGLPATAIGWGFWEAAEGMGATLTGTELARLRRSGVGALTPEQGMRYLDAALVAGQPHVLATPTWPTTIRAWSSRVPKSTKQSSHPSHRTSAPAERTENRWVAMSPAERADAVSTLVRDAVAQALGYASGSEIDARRGFLDMGVDSLAAVELRNQLSRATGVRLSATALIDYPSVEQLGAHVTELLADQISHAATDSAASFDPEALLAQLAQANREPSIDRSRHDPLLAQLRQLTAKLTRDPAAPEHDLTPATDDEIFDLIDNELGLSRDEAL
ncbi:type I polyketide synthase [Nocardia callitridis]|uniref:Polyketide synthase n=1 Tax=Nocardia callitridis TaxID=648753 RepID=A0ABP9KYG6_9NOCA